MHYPSATQTFIEREMFALAGQGLQIEVRPIWDFRPASRTDRTLPPGMTVVRSGGPVRVLASMLAGTARELLRRPALLLRGLRLLLGNLPRHGEGWFMTLWGTLTALSLAAGFRRGGAPDVFHGTWATAPATAAAVLGELCGRPFSFGAHAYDVHRHGGDPLLGPKLRAAIFVHTTTQANVDHLRNRFPGSAARIILSRRGLSQEAFRRAGEIAAARPARVADAAFRLLSVGRLVGKKGQLYQIAACAELARRGRPVRLRIIGEGPLRADLAARVTAAGLDGSVTLDGALPPAEVWDAYTWADTFWHTGIVDTQGDRDGLPNVVPEAMACALPVISSVAGGAGEAVHDGVTGLVVEDPANATALADAVERLALDAELCARLGRGGREWVEANFLAEVNTRLLAEAFTGRVG
ncbi:MAG: glycosyltransferase family 4 protein [Gluconacetobacter diazotrophicus]|nr:glycosyltransferase family 4 protein [Gluconacetobacter diazotrophicus]